MNQVFKAHLVGRGPSGSWPFLPIPFNAEKEFGSKARVPVCETINGFPSRNSLMLEGDGTHSMMVSKKIQAGAAVSKSDLVSVIIDVGKAERIAVVPAELKKALRGVPAAKRFFEQLSYSRQKEYADWVGGAKRVETRSARISRSIELLHAKRKLT